MAELLTISEVSKRSGVAASALRFYEDKGLIRSERSGAGHRRYPRSVLRLVAFIVFAQRVGLSLDEVHDELARLPKGRVPEGADWQKLSAAWSRRIDAKIAELQKMRETLASCIGCGCLSMQSCRFANPGDRAARSGPGPRFWIVP